MRRTANKDAGRLIAAREPFQGSNFAGRNESHLGPTGRLDHSERKRYEAALRDVADAGTRLYVVYSYATPIAWTPATGRANWHVTTTRYSVSTSRHVGIVRAGVAAAASHATRTGAATASARQATPTRINADTATALPSALATANRAQAS